MSERDTVVLWLVCGLLALLPRPVTGQSTDASQAPDPAPASQPSRSLPGTTYSPITTGQRVGWIVDGTVGAKGLRIGIVASAWQTAVNSPEEWGRTGSGFGKRYLEREADVAISSAIEAGVGAIWGEDPRYIRSQRRGAWPRTRYAMKTVFLAPRRDGRLAPAWGRVVGNVMNNVIENSWLPPSVTTSRQTMQRTIDGFVGRLAGNLWFEFWPEIRKRFPGAERIQ